MTSSCPTPPDMDDCKRKKKRCLSGPCVGFTYTDGEECPVNTTFNPEACQCEQICTWRGDGKITITRDPFTHQLCLVNDDECSDERTITTPPTERFYSNAVLPITAVKFTEPPTPYPGEPQCAEPGTTGWKVYNGDGVEIDEIRLSWTAVCWSSGTTPTGSIEIEYDAPDTSCGPDETFNPETCECEPDHPNGVYEVITQSLHPKAKSNDTFYHYFMVDDTPVIGQDGGLYFWNIGITMVDTGRVCSSQAQCDTGVGCTDDNGNPVTSMVAWELFCADDIGGVDPAGYAPNDPCGNGFHNLFAPTWGSVTHFEEGLCTSFCLRNPDYSGILPNFRFGLALSNESGYLPAYNIYAERTGWNRIQCSDEPAYMDVTLNYIGPGRICDYYEGVSCGARSQAGGNTGLTPK